MAIDAVGVFIVSLISGLVGFNLAWLGQRGAVGVYLEARDVLQLVELSPVELGATFPALVAAIFTIVGFGIALGQFRLREVV